MRQLRHSVFSNRIRDEHGNLKHISPFNLNIRPNVGNDWQFGVMAGDNITGAQMSKTATASSATSITVAAGLTASALIDHIIYAGANSAGAGAICWGVCTANTATVITVDKWYDPTNPGGVAIGPPNATAQFQVSPNKAPAVYLATSATVQSGAAGDTTLPGEIGAGDGLSRAYPTTFTHSASSSAYSIAKTFTATTTKTVNSQAIFTAASAGTPAFISAETSAPTLVSGDTLAQTDTVNY